MATSNNRDVKMTLSVQTLGEEDIKKLQTSVSALAKEGGDAAPEFQKLADEIGRIGEQAEALRTFTALSDEAANLAQRQQQAADTSTELRTKLEALSAVTQEAGEKQRLAAVALQTAQQAARETRDELATLTATTDRAGKAEASYASEVQRLKLAKIEQRAEIERLSDALTQSNIEVKAAEDAESKLATTYNRAAAAADKATRALEANAAKVRQAADSALDLGVSTDNIAASQSELTQALNRTGHAAQDLQTKVERLANTERELAGIRAFEAQVQAAARLQTTAEYARLFDEALQRLATSERELSQQSNAAQWQREAESLVEAAHAAQEMARRTEVLTAAQKELTAQRAFEAQAADARKLLQAAEYVRFWRDELDKAEAQARQTADEARLSAERIKNAFGTIGVRSAQELQSEIVQVRAAMETVRTSTGLTGGALKTAFSAGEAKIRELEQELRKVNGTLTMADSAANLFKNSLGQIAAGNLIADGVGYLVNKVKELGLAFVTTIVQTEQLRRGLLAVYKDSSIAASQFQVLKAVATSAGISVGDVSKVFLTFSAATRSSGMSLQETNAVFGAVTRAAGLLGLSGEQVTGTLEALSQMASKGTVSMEELRQQLGDRLPGALSLVAKGLGLSEAALIKMVESGGLAARDLFPALTKSLGNLRGETEGLLPSWNALKNSLTETAQNAGDSGWTQLLTLGLKTLTAMLGVVILPLTALSEVIFGLAKSAGILVGALVTLTNPLDALREVADKAAERQARLTQTFNDTVFGAKTAADAVANHNQKMVDTGTAAAAAAVAVASTAKAQEAQAFAAKLAADKTLDHSSKIVQLKAFIDELLSSQNKQIEASNKLAKAAKIEGDSLIALAALRGDDFALIEAQVDAAEKNLRAMENSATAQRTETELLVLKRDEIIKTAIAQDGNTKRRKEEIDEINKKILASEAETEQTKQAAAAAEQEAASRRLAIQSYKDNSAALLEYDEAVQAAERTLAAFIAEQAQGRATDEEVANARRRAAEATHLLNDAVKDSIKALDLESRAKQANLNLTLTKTQLEQRNYESLAQAARATGEHTLALHYEIEARRKQIAAIKLTSEAKRLEAEATTTALQIERAALAQTDPMLKQKQAEIDIRLANAKAKLLEANAGKDAIAALEREITLLLQNNDSRKGSSAGIERDTSVRRKNTESIYQQTEALKKQNLTADGFAANKDGSASGQFNNSTPLDKANAIIDKSRDGTLTAGDLGAAQEALQQAKTAKAWLDSVNQASVSFGAQESATARVREAQAALDQVSRMAAQGGRGAPGAEVGAGPQTRGATQTVNINVNGRSTAVNVASDADAKALTSVLRQLESAAGAAS